MKFGKFDISLINFGNFRLDGGAMFGSVPKNIWERRIKADSENCIGLATNSLVIRADQRCFLIDVGMGEKWTDKERSIFAIRNTPRSDWGINPEEVTDIILTHLHFDHSGGISEYENTSKDVRLVFPSARVHLQEANLKNAEQPNVRERASYLKENVASVKNSKLTLLKGSTEIFPGIWGHQVNGHTVGQQWVEIKSDETSLVFPTDLIPTSHHLPIPFSMGYDICTNTLLSEKTEFLTKAEKEGWIVVFEHDRDLPAARIGRDERGHFAVKEQVMIPTNA